jgi:SAM-dependent methyltransferase
VSIWQAMQTETLRGVPISVVIGGGDPKVIADTIIGSINRMMPIAPGSTVLDVGCGCGRIAAGLTGTLSDQGTYIGIDIVPGLIDFARRHITTAYPNFQFHVRNQRNSSYDYFIDVPSGIETISAVAPNGTVDRAIATSLFTHLDFPEAVPILMEIAQALKTSGALFMTCFIIPDGPAGPKKRAFTFKHRSDSGKAMLERAEDPHYAVGMTLEQIKSMLAASGLEIVRINRGSWAKVSPGPSFQDEIVAMKYRAASSWWRRLF